MHTRILVTGLAAVAALAAAGCGGSDNSASTAGESTTTASTQTITISETDFKLDPSTVTIDEAGTYEFEAVNDGETDHALEIEGNGVEKKIDTLAPGESGTVTVDLEAGTYEMYCPIGNHRAMGMEGEISVG